jgi:hypothetical protein
MVLRLIQRYTGRYAKPPAYGKHPTMTWPEFVARVEAQTRLDDSALVLDIDVYHPRLDGEIDLCVLAGKWHRNFWERIFKDHPGWKKHGYLVVWKDRGSNRYRGRRDSSVEIPKAVVLTPGMADKRLTWKTLRLIVENHRDYSPHLLVNTIDIDSCSPDFISIEINYDWLKPSLVVRGEPGGRDRSPDSTIPLN